MKATLGLLAMFAVPLAACGGDGPQVYSEPVGINFKAKSSDSQSGVVLDQKSISSETSNPYGHFVDGAQDMMGQDPSRVEVSELTLLLGAQSIGVTTLGEIFDGNVEVLFVMHDTHNTFAVGHVDVGPATGSGPIQLAVTFDSATVQGVDWDKLLGGNFDVVIRGPATVDFVTGSVDANLQTTFHFAAYE